MPLHLVLSLQILSIPRNITRSNWFKAVRCMFFRDHVCVAWRRINMELIAIHTRLRAIA